MRFVALKLHGYAILSAMNQSVETTSSRQTFPPDSIGMQESFSGFSGRPAFCPECDVDRPRTVNPEGHSAGHQMPVDSIPAAASTASYGIRIELAQSKFTDPSCIA